MTTSTPNLALVLYNSTTDSAEYFSNFRAVIAGTSLTSNFYKIDTAYGSMQTEIDEIQAGAYFTLASFISANYYEATVSGITAYNTGMKIILQLNTASAGTVTLNINSLGIKSVMKIDATGTPVNISAGELMVGKYYFFAYDGTRWVWVEANSADQIYSSGTSGNFLRVSASNTIEDSGSNPSTFAVAAKGVTNGDTHNHLGGDGSPITNLTEDVYFSGDISPSQITSDQNDYAPTGLSSASLLRLDSNADRNITGLSGGGDGRIISIHNIGSFTITLVNSSSSSIAGNRFLLSSDLNISSNTSILLQYDSVSSRWRLIGGSGGGGSTKGRVEFLSATVPTTLGAPIGQINGGSSPVEGFPYFSFVDGTITYRDFYCRLIDYSGGGLTLNFEILRTSATAALRYVFEAGIRRINSGTEDITASHTYDYNTVTITIPSGPPAAGIPMSGTITFADGTDMDNLANNDAFVLRFRRNATSGTDDATDTARVLSMITMRET